MYMSSNNKYRTASLVAAAIAAALGTSMLHAAEAAEEETVELEEVIVTGTRRTGMTVDDSPAPVQIVTAEALQQSAAPDLMNALSFQVPSFNASQQGTDMSSPTLVANMRALSPNHTLILVNGRRRHVTSNVNVAGAGSVNGAATADLSFIPTAAIASTQVLTDGAAAIYGSDAIAGVINFITKKDYTGGSISVGASGYDTGDGLTKNVQGNFGIGSELGYFNMAFEVERRDTMNRFGQPYGAAVCVAARLNSLTGCGPSGDLAPNGELTPQGYAISTTAALARVNEYNMVYHPWFPYNQHQGDPPEIERNVGMFSTGLNFANGMELSATGSFGTKETSSTQSYRRPSQDGGVDVNGDGDRSDFIAGPGSRVIVTTPVVYTLDRPGTLPGIALTLTEADLNMYPLGFNPNIETNEKDWEFNVGLSGELVGWTFDLSTGYGKDWMDIYTTNSMNFGLWNTFGYSQTSFYDGRFTADQWDTSLDLSRDFDVGLASPLTVAVGAEYREDSYAINAGEASSYYGPGGASFPGYSPLAAGSHKRDNSAVYANVIFNPTENWLVDIAGRLEDYSDFGSKTVGKFTTRYDFSDMIAVRGTFSTGFRAPTMGESYYTAIQVGPTSATATLAAATVGGGLKPETSQNISLGVVLKPLPDLTTTIDIYQIKIDNRTRLGSFDYSDPQGPTTRCSRGIPAGCVANPLLPDPANTDGVGLPDDAYNRILGDALVAGGFISQWDNPAAPGGSFDSSARANIGLSFFTNVLDTKTSGIDWVVDYNTQFEMVRIDWLLAANYNKTEVTRAGRASGFESIPLFGITDIWAIEENSPEFRVNLGATVHLGDKVTLNIRENIYGPQSTIASAAAWDTEFPAIYSTLDIVDRSKIAGIAAFAGLPATAADTPYYKAEIGTLATTNLELSYKPFGGLRFTVGSDNVFDKYPTKRPAAIAAYDTARYNNAGSRDYLLGSPVGFFGRRLFAKVAYTW
jgi:iron complex outermembrane recepter protein